MRILFVSPRYYPHIGGVEYVVKSVAERIVKRGHEVTVLCGDSGISEPLEEEVNGVRVLKWPSWSPGNAYHVPRVHGKLIEKLSELARIHDVVHFHSVHSVITMQALDALKNHPVHKALTPYYHGTGHTLFRRILWTGWRFYVRKLLKHVDVVHTVSRLEAELVERDFGIRAVPIENGVDEWILSVEWKPSNYAMYSGRIEKYKNIHRLANIVKLLDEEHGLNLELRIYGDGSYVNNLEKYLSTLGIEYRLSPPQPFEQYIKALSMAFFFGLLSEKESYPQSVNEANAIGVPVVVAMPWGLNFIGRTRTLVINPEKSDREIAGEIAEFLKRIWEQPKSTVSSWSEVVDLYVKLLYKKA